MMKRTLQDENAIGLLPLTVRYRPHERSISLLRRLATRRGSPTLNKFLADIRHFPFFTLNAMASGRKLDILARMSGISEELIRASTPVRTDRGFVIGSVLIERAGRLMPGNSNGRWCPRCLTEDLERHDGPLDCRPYRRFWWDLEEIIGCPKHGVPLASTCPSCEKPARLVNLRPDRCDCGEDLAGMQAGEPVENFDRVLTQVMLGRKAPVWAEGMSVRTMSGLASRMGILDEFGPRRLVPSSLDPAVRMELAARGASILGAGGGELFQVLDRAAARGTARTPGQLYGELWAWLDRSHPADEASLMHFKRQLGEHAGSALRNVRETELWGRRIPPHRSRNGEPAGHHGTATVADGESGHRTGRLEDLAAAMGIRVPQIHSTPDGSAGERLPGAVRGAWMTYRYDVGGVTALLRDATRTPVFDVVRPDMVEVMQATLIKRRWADVYRALREGRLRVAGRLRGKAGVPSLLVFRQEAREACAFEDPAGWEATISRAQGCSRLGITRKTMAALKKAKVLRFALRRTPRGGAVWQPCVESIEAFEREMITAVEIHRLTGTSIKKVINKLRSSGIISILERRAHVQACYKRGEALDVFELIAHRDEAA